MAHAHDAVGAKVKHNYDRRGLPGTQVVKLPSGKSVDEAITKYLENPDVLYVTPNYRISIPCTTERSLLQPRMGNGEDPGH